MHHTYSHIHTGWIDSSYHKTKGTLTVFCGLHCNTEYFVVDYSIRLHKLRRDLDLGLQQTMISELLVWFRNIQSLLIIPLLNLHLSLSAFIISQSTLLLSTLSSIAPRAISRFSQGQIFFCQFLFLLINCYIGLRLYLFNLILLFDVSIWWFDDDGINVFILELMGSKFGELRANWIFKCAIRVFNFVLLTLQCNP